MTKKLILLLAALAVVLIAGGAFLVVWSIRARQPTDNSAPSPSSFGGTGDDEAVKAGKDLSGGKCSGS